MSDLDHCKDCGALTVFDNLKGEAQCVACFDNDNEAAYERRMARELAGGGGSTPCTPNERMEDAHRLNREGR